VLELLRPPPHRGPLIAAGTVVLTVGIALEELRLRSEVGPVVHVLILAVAAGVVLALGLQAPTEEGRPPAYQSVLLVCGLLLLYPALLRLADALGGDFASPGSLTWTALVQCGAALWISVRRRSAICLLIAAIAAGVAVLAAWEWVFDPGSFTPFRWLLLLMSVGLVLGSLALRAGAPRHAELLIDAAGVAILAIGLQSLFGFLSFGVLGGRPDTLLPNFWELVLLFAGCGLVAYGAVDRRPGPAWLGVANLVTFVFVTGGVSEATLYWWSLVLIVLGAGAMVAGLRPRDPLPPEPDAYRAGEQPLASRTADDEVVLRVRDEGPPRGSVPDR
jgi:hypothetical protein